MQINLPPERANDPQDLFVESIILHELGHALGLGHAPMQQDAMYTAVDSFPQSYGLPSTLNLYALHQLSQAADMAGLGRSICLPSDIPYGLPPWVYKSGTIVELRIPGARYVMADSGMILAPQSVVRGSPADFTDQVRNEGRYPLRLAVASAMADFGPPIQPKERLPLTIEPLRELELHYTLPVPGDVGSGEHTTTFNRVFQYLTVAGWSTERVERSFTISFDVSEPGPPTFVFTGGTTVMGTQIIGVVPQVDETAFNTAKLWEYFVIGLLSLAVVVVFVAVYSSTHRRRSQPRDSSPLVG